ncbi:MAG: hypothetical protein U1E91_05960 [Moraxella sp.]
MAYITTNHRFIIDDKHPSDVFDEMENFFSLYTTAIDDLQRVSVQLSVPTSFDITANKKMAESYRQFTQSLKYTMPDIHILPIKTHNPQTADDDDTASEADNSVILLIQRLDGYALDDEDEKPSLYPSLYRSLLGRLIPRFAEEKSATGHYPERPQSPCLSLSGNQRLQPRYLFRHNHSLLKLIKCLCDQQYRLQSPIQCLQLRRCSRRWSIPSLHHISHNLRGCNHRCKRQQLRPNRW